MVYATCAAQYVPQHARHVRHNMWHSMRLSMRIAGAHVQQKELHAYQSECSRSCVHIKTHIVEHVMTRAHLDKDLYAHRHHARHLRARFQLPAAGAGLESGGYARVEGGRYNAGVGLCISRLR